MRLRRAFFEQKAKVVAEKLIGSTLVVQLRGRTERILINETEAYLGPHDLACHTARGRTSRNEVMFGPGGFAYVYLIYGMYWMLNVVTGREGEGEAVLIRGGVLLSESKLNLNGPGKLSRHLKISRAWNGRSLFGPEVYFEASQTRLRILKTPRIGVDYAGEWAKKKLRYLIKN